MKKPYYSWFASDFLGSPFVQSLEPLEEFCYRRLLDMQATSEDGRISGDVKKMKAQCKHLATFPRIWEIIKIKFEPHPDGLGGYANARLMDILAERDAYLQGRSRAGQAGAKARWKDGLANGSAMPELCQTGDERHDKSIASTSTSTSKGEKKGKKGIGPTAEKRVGRIDPAADVFKDAYLLHVGNPYGWLEGDFPQLAKLRDRLGLIHPSTPQGWVDAVTNYFASPFSEYTLKHFASKYDTFKNSSLDRYKVPVNHANGGNENGAKPSLEQQKRINTQAAIQRVFLEGAVPPLGVISDGTLGGDN